ncbi:hypothetical protein TELCIR_16418 [Teladorsagia circumcincta]|uniref:RRM domain-containing protein n=1 Tax=Teladorsagia circumcincta TaxID=45464 RepID=A0A2G9TXS0_TELCI|nr:hypothetical protein TELCIR_16418 [Teladorsagia circumcincta]
MLFFGARQSSHTMVTKTKKVFIGGLSASSTLEDMKTYFEQYGKVEDAMLMFDKATQRHRVFNQMPGYSGLPSSPGSSSSAAAAIAGRGGAGQPFDATAALYANLSAAQPFGDGGLYVSPQPLHTYHNKV